MGAPPLLLRDNGGLPRFVITVARRTWTHRTGPRRKPDFRSCMDPVLLVHLRELEEHLLIPSVRKDADAVSALLADDFLEYGSSGRIYSRAEILAALQDEPPAELSLT